MTAGNIIQDSRSLRMGLALTFGLILFVGCVLTMHATRPHTLARAQGATFRYVDRTNGTDSDNDCTNRSAPCATIGYALAQAEEGDTILVAKGTYTENLVITKTVTLKGGYEPVGWSRCLRSCTTTIDGDQTGQVIAVRSTLSETTVIDGFSITNGDGGISTLLSSVAIQNSKIVHNHRTGWGSGGITADRSYVTISNTLIADNTAPGRYAAMLVISTPVDPWVESSVIINSSTIANNRAPEFNGIMCSLSWCRFVNSIVWGHEGENFDGELGRYLATCSNIEGGWPGEGNISEAPCFVDPVNGDYHLCPGSPCIDAGCNESAPATDFEGDLRPFDGDRDGTAVTDMGADEFVSYHIRLYLPTIMKGWKQLRYWAGNHSYCTTCAEEDNVNVPIFANEIGRFRVVAPHPTYEIGIDNCEPDFSGCGSGDVVGATQADSCFDDPSNKLYDDHSRNAIWVCPEPDWWRPHNMRVLVDGDERTGHRLVWIRRIERTDSWPQFLVLYQDGNLRLKPHPPLGRADVCFGSSVIIGPATPAVRPYADIQEIRVTPSTMSLELIYRGGGTAHIDLSVDRSQAIGWVDVGYGTNASIPFATFRSMQVSSGNADVDHVGTPAGDYFFIAGSPASCSRMWTTLAGPWWFFHRMVRSEHNTSAPDILIEVLE
jgi:hypothetical protein